MSKENEEQVHAIMEAAADQIVTDVLFDNPNEVRDLLNKAAQYILDNKDILEHEILCRLDA